MAALDKYCAAEVVYELRHNTREAGKPPANKDIDPERTKDNYSLAPADRGGAQPDNKATAT